MPVRSSGDVRSAIAGLLAADLPARVARVRETKSLSALEVPDISQVHDGQTPDEAFEATVLENRVWIVVTNPRHVPPMRLVDWRAGEPVYETRYACQIELWAFGVDWDNAMTVRDEAESAVRFSLIENSNLSLDHQHETGYALHPPTVMSQFGVPFRVPNGGHYTWAPALVSVDMRAEDVMADATPVPPKPFDGIGLYYVKMPVGENLADPDTEQGQEQIKEWTYGQPHYTEQFGQQLGQQGEG